MFWSLVQLIVQEPPYFSLIVASWNSLDGFIHGTKQNRVCLSPTWPNPLAIITSMWRKFIIIRPVHNPTLDFHFRDIHGKKTRRKFCTELIDNCHCSNLLTIWCQSSPDDILECMYAFMQLLEKIAPATERLKEKGIEFSLWYKPDNYQTDFWSSLCFPLFLLYYCKLRLCSHF